MRAAVVMAGLLMAACAPAAQTELDQASTPRPHIHRGILTVTQPRTPPPGSQDRQLPEAMGLLFAFGLLSGASSTPSAQVLRGKAELDRDH